MKRTAPSVAALAALALSSATPAAAQCPVARLSRSAVLGPPPTTSFGRAVAVSRPRVAVGTGSLGGVNEVHVFREQAGRLLLEEVVSNPGVLPDFGREVALSGDRLAIGSPDKFGRVYVLERATTWSLTAELASPAGGISGFGSSVALDGDDLLVAAAEEDRVYFFERTPSGAWAEAASFPAALPTSTVAFDESDSAALAGGLAVVGSGSTATAYIYEKLPTGWTLVQTLAPAVPLFSRFGESVAVAPGRVAVGDPFDLTLGLGAGAVFVYEKSGASWTLAEQVLPPAGAALGFGTRVALEGTRLLAAGQTELGPPDRVHLLELGPGGYAPAGVLEPLAPESAQGEPTGAYGLALAASGGWAAIGGPAEANCGCGHFGSVEVLDLDELACRSLVAQHGTASMSSPFGGAKHHLHVDFGPARAGAVYVVLGSAGGTAPAVEAAPGVPVPLAFDGPGGYLLFTLRNQANPVFQDTLGFLDAQGRADAALLAFPGDPALAGIVLHHAAVVFDAALVPAAASNAEALALVL